MKQKFVSDCGWADMVTESDHWYRQKKNGKMAMFDSIGDFVQNIQQRPQLGYYQNNK